MATDANLREAQAQTPLGIVNEIYDRGDFGEVPGGMEIGENDIVLGEMTDYERAIYLAHNMIENDTIGLLIRLLSEHNPETAAEIQAKLLQSKAKSNLLNNLLWASILERLAGTLKEYESVIICAGWTLVKRPDEKVFLIKYISTEDDIPGPCDDCPLHDECNDPRKQLRH